ncbi:PEP/pyruvate-binding domain-containing protein [Nonomuraea sp. NPDC050310]|uniref:PEP/pyruvate-binding domain-containing protein n=1 Tax=Nonomuraea sp. NPDC050310 TaxID=3154935 RepID=UPI0033EFA060
MIVALAEAVAGTCGGKAGALGALIRAGLPVPGGFVVPFAAYLAAVRGLDLREPSSVRQAIEARPLDAALVEALGRALDELGEHGELGGPPVAVRSSAANEDTGLASAAGQHESFLGVRGVDAVAEAVRGCWASLFTSRAVGYRGGSGEGELAMAVLVQRHLDAEVSGVMFTPSHPGGPTEIEASWGLGPSVVEGRVTPDSYRVAGDGAVLRTLADKRTRLDRRGGQLVVSDVPASSRRRAALNEATVARLAGLGAEIAALRGGPQDIEWALADGHLWILQSRPITAALPGPPARPAPLSAALPGPPGSPLDLRAATLPPPAAAVGVLVGTGGSQGVVTGTARIVRGPADFGRVRPGDILVCPYTDPAWTPLLRVAAGVVTETGGLLSHAAIVAREHGIPAVLGAPEATTRLRDGSAITLDGTSGTVTYPATAS